MKTKQKKTPLQPIQICPALIGIGQTLPIFASCVQAGFPSPADDYEEKPLDLNDLVIKHPSATFFVRVQGDSMLQAGMFDGDILVVDRSLSPANGAIILAVLEGEFTVKRLVIKGNKTTLVPENPAYPSIKITPESQFQVWGVVTYVIHKAQ